MLDASCAGRGSRASTHQAPPRGALCHLGIGVVLRNFPKFLLALGLLLALRVVELPEVVLPALAPQSPGVVVAALDHIGHGLLTESLSLLIITDH